VSTSGELNLIAEGTTHTIGVSHDGYPSEFGREILAWVKATVWQDKNFIETIYPFSLYVDSPISYFSGYGEWIYTVNVNEKTFEVEGFTTMGDKLTLTWGWDNLPTPEEIELLFDDEGDDSQEW